MAVGVSLLGASIYLLVMNKYDEWEASTRAGLEGYVQEIYDLMDRMFMRKTMNQCYLMILVPTGALTFLGLLAGVAFGIAMSLILGAVLGFVGFKLPRFIVRTMFKKRNEKFDAQLVLALNMMANAIKSGLSFLQVIQLLERELPDPARQEFAMVLKENRIGVTLNEALTNMSNRVPSADLFMIINSVVTLSQQGGDLSEAFDTIALTIRDRRRVDEKIKTMAAAGITQGIILSSLPFAMLAAMYFMQPESVKILFTTTLGLGMLLVMVVLLICGAIWIRKILTIDI